MAKTARVIFDSTEHDKDLFYSAGVHMIDPHLYVEINGEQIVFTHPLELNRLRKAKQLTGVLDVIEYHQKGKKLVEGKRKYTTNYAYALVLHALLCERGIKKLEVPETFPLDMARALDQLGYTLEIVSPFQPNRLVKSPEEISLIQDAVKRTEEAIWKAHAILTKATIGSGGLLTYKGETVTAEMLKGEMGAYLIRYGYVPLNTICAPGVQATDPHGFGTGPIRVGELLVIDIFPFSMDHGYYADITRTFIKGDPTERQAAMYSAVLEAQEEAEKLFAPGVTLRVPSDKAREVLRTHGFRTNMKAASGFFHALSHGMGLEVHEAPLSYRAELAVGHVVSNEPGLYYKTWKDGVRLEDDLVITEDGCRNLCSFPKDEWIID